MRVDRLLLVRIALSYEKDASLLYSSRLVLTDFSHFTRQV
jgi:hypothetical protein